MYCTRADGFRAVAATHGAPTAYVDMRAADPVIRPGIRKMPLGRVVEHETGRPYCRSQNDQSYIERPAIVVAAVESRVLGPFSECRCSRRTSSSAPSHLSPGGAAVHRQADRTGQELRRPGRHRHREHAAAQRAARIACSSRPPPPTCSRSSAARRSICRRCSTRWSRSAAQLCEADSGIHLSAKGEHYHVRRKLRVHTRVR